MTAVKFERVSKAYDLFSGNRTLFTSLKMVTGAQSPERLFFALSDVSFEVQKGQAFGIIGRNGAGKSTLLKIIAGITKPTSGVATVNGSVSSLIELGAGFHPDMTGRENVYMSAAILGIPRREIEGKFGEIVDFAELWDFIDVPVKKYSSGMYARLGFAVAVTVNPDILVVDEILSVGDIFFQQKCFTKMRQIIRQGTTFVYVTHDTAAMQNLCDCGLLLDNGKIEFIGPTTETVNRYYAKIGKRASPAHGGGQHLTGPERGTQMASVSSDDIIRHSILRGRYSRHGGQGIEIIALSVSNSAGEHVFHVPMEEELFFDVLLRANETIREPRVGMNLYDRMANLVFAAGTPQLKYTLPSMKPKEELIVRLELRFTVGPGEYTFSVNASEPSESGNPNTGFFHDVHEMLGPIRVVADEHQVYPFYGIAKLPMKITSLHPVR
jgi:ABC-type polysaccharide/polyol phosphate transport system ATPase subunit